MDAAQAVILIAGSLAMMSAMIAWMSRVTKSEQQLMARRHEEWIAGGSIPDEKPNFHTCSGGSGG